MTLSKIKKTLLVLIAFFSIQISFAQCNEIYVTNTALGTGTGTKIDPISLDSALSQSISGDIIKLATGVYNINNAITLSSNITIEGGFIETNNWQKTSLAGATSINRTFINPEGPINAQRIVAVYGNSISGFKIQDVTISTANANLPGMSTYGIHLNSCSNYNIVRCQILPGLAANGADGTTIAGSGGAGGGGNPGGGGSGNQGCNANGQAGGNGSSGNGGAALGTGGAGAIGQGCNIFGCNALSVAGSPGNPGAAGALGTNAPTTAPTTNAVNFPFFIPNGQSANGTNGYGGGGGGGGGGMSKGSDCTCSFFGTGNGGAGGAGGNGGLAGTGGFGGGGSFGIYLANNLSGGNFIDLDIVQNTISTGGIAGTGQSGTLGLGGGPSQTAGCGGNSSASGSGGNGGNGGKGGNGQPGANGLSSKIVINGIQPNMTQGSTLVTLTPGENNPSDVNLSAQPEITWNNEICAFNTVTFTSISSGNWNFGISSSPTSIIGDTVTTQFLDTGRQTIDFDGNIYSGFVYITPHSADSSNAGVDQQLCGSSIGTLAGNIPNHGTGIWTSLGTATVDVPTQNNSTLFGLSPGDNLFVWTINNGTCCPEETDTININNLPNYNVSQSASICNGASYTLGTQTLISGGTYSELFQSINGCDSNVVLTLTINAIDTSISQNGATLMSNENGGTYQWVDCSTSTNLTSETNQNFTATVNGSYKVIISKNNCVDSSACQTINSVSVIENGFGTVLSVYPNPAVDILSINLNEILASINIKILDIRGKTISNYSIYNKDIITLDVKDFETGIYIVELSSENNSATIRFIKE